MMTRWFNKNVRDIGFFGSITPLGYIIDILDLFCNPDDLVAYSAFQNHHTVFHP